MILRNILNFTYLINSLYIIILAIIITCVVYSLEILHSIINYNYNYNLSPRLR